MTKPMTHFPDDLVERLAIALAEARCWPGCWAKANDVERNAWLFDASAALTELAKTHDLVEHEVVKDSLIGETIKLAVGQVWKEPSERRKIVEYVPKDDWLCFLGEMGFYDMHESKFLAWIRRTGAKLDGVA